MNLRILKEIENHASLGTKTERSYKQLKDIITKYYLVNYIFLNGDVLQ